MLNWIESWKNRLILGPFSYQKIGHYHGLLPVPTGVLSRGVWPLDLIQDIFPIRRRAKKIRQLFPDEGCVG